MHMPKSSLILSSYLLLYGVNASRLYGRSDVHLLSRQPPFELSFAPREAPVLSKRTGEQHSESNPPEKCIACLKPLAESDRNSACKSCSDDFRNLTWPPPPREVLERSKFQSQPERPDIPQAKRQRKAPVAHPARPAQLLSSQTRPSSARVQDRTANTLGAECEKCKRLAVGTSMWCEEHPDGKRRMPEEPKQEPKPKFTSFTCGADRGKNGFGTWLGRCRNLVESEAEICSSCKEKGRRA